MIGLDTNILVRYITQDDKRQAARATKIIESELSGDVPGFISSVVLVELSWTLSRLYNVNYDILNTLLERLLKSKELTFEHREEAWKALHLNRKENYDFADSLIGLINKSNDCDYTLTFDKKAGKLDFFRMA